MVVGVTRRSMLRGTAAAVLVPLAVTGVAAAAADTSSTLGPGTRRALEAAVGTKVRIVGQGGLVTATLARVDDLRHAAAGHPDAFTACFHLDGDGAAALGNGLADVELQGRRLSRVGLLPTGTPDHPRAVLLVDRRPVSEHPTAPRA